MGKDNRTARQLTFASQVEREIKRSGSLNPGQLSPGDIFPSRLLPSIPGKKKNRFGYYHPQNYDSRSNPHKNGRDQVKTGRSNLSLPWRAFNYSTSKRS